MRTKLGAVNVEVPRERLPNSERLFGATVGAAYGLAEVVFAVAGAMMSIMSPLVAPADGYTLLLLVGFPLTGALAGRFAVVALAAAYALNAVALLDGRMVAVPVVSAVAAAVLFRRSPWAATLTLLLPVWLARDYGANFPTATKVLLAGAALAAVILLGRLAAKRRWSLHPAVTLGLFALTMLGGTFAGRPGPRDLPPDAPPPRVSSPNIVLIVMDTVRADHLSVYGYARNTTPELARFAKTATLYTRAYSPSNMTLPSHASIFTGLYGSEHTAHIDEGWSVGRPLPAQALTIAELLAARGYATASIVANGYLGEAFGLDQGFQHLDARAPEMPYGIMAPFYLRSGITAVASRIVQQPRNARRNSRGGEEISDLAIAYLDRMSGKRRPFFLLLNYLDAHHPYIPPPPYDTMFPGYDATQPDELSERLVRAFGQGRAGITPSERAHLISQYDGSIAHADRQIARVFAALQQRGVFDNTLVVVLSDHGESFGEHGVMSHSASNYDSVTHVPLIVKKPGQKAGEVVTQPVSLLDVWPLLSSTPRPPSPVITEAFPFRGALAAVPWRHAGTAKVAGTLKTIVNVAGKVETYDLATDPIETRNLAPNADSQRMAAELAAWRRSLRGVAPVQSPEAIDPETVRRLRALGYIQ